MIGPDRGTEGAHRPLVRWAVFALLFLVALHPLAGASPEAAVPAPSIRDSPGWYPPADPESLSERIGRRLNAPAVRARFTGGGRSLDELGRAVLWALHHSDADSLRRLCVTRKEFSHILWREFPQSRPATGLTADDAWGVLERRFVAGVNGALVEHGGRPLRFLRIERTDSTRHYRNFQLHNGLVIVAVNERGDEERLRFVRAAVERRGRFKIQSTTD
jgi:hypothetical protein